VFAQTLSSAQTRLCLVCANGVFSGEINHLMSLWLLGLLSYRRSFLVLSMKKSFRDSRILLWVPKDGECHENHELLRKFQIDILESSPDGFH